MSEIKCPRCKRTFTKSLFRSANRCPFCNIVAETRDESPILAPVFPVMPIDFSSDTSSISSIDFGSSDSGFSGGGGESGGAGADGSW